MMKTMDLGLKPCVQASLLLLLYIPLSKVSNSSSLS